MRKHLIRNRKVRYGGITVVLTVLVVATVVLANATLTSLSTRFGWSINMNDVGLFDVTDDCYEYLDRVFQNAETRGGQAKAQIIFCNLPENFEDEPTQSQLYHTANQLAARFPEHIQVTCYDILSNPNTVRDYATSVDPHTGEVKDIPVPTTSVIVVGEGYHRVYSLAEFFSFKDNTAENLWAYNGERKLAAGLMRAISPDRPTACLTNNHGEVYFDYEILYLLDDAGYNVTYLDLYKEEIPEDCSLIVSYNPTSDMVEDELSVISERTILEDFLSRDGNAFWVFFSNGSPELTNYEAFLETWGVDFNYYTANENRYRYMVQDTTQSLTSDGYTIYGEAIASGKSGELLANLNRHAIFKNATAIKPASGFVNNGDGSYEKGDRTLFGLYTGGENAVSWANGKPVDGADDAILMSLTRQTVNGANSYVGVVSSAEFATENFIQSAVYCNADVMCAALEFQGRENTPIGITTKPYEQTEISTVTTRQMLMWTLGLTLTPAVVITGLAVVILVKRRYA